MKLKKIDHIGILVKDLEEAKRKFSEGLKLPLIKEDVVKEQGVKMAFYDCGGVWLEVMEPICEGAGTEFLARTGGGIHHIAYEVDDVYEAHKVIGESFDLKHDRPLPGACDTMMFFLKCEELFNIETEFVQLPEEG